MKTQQTTLGAAISAALATKAANIAAAKVEQTEQKETREGRDKSVKAGITKRADKGADTAKAKAEAAKMEAAKAARMAEVSPVARDIGAAILHAEDASANVSALIISAHCSGFGFAELESVDLTGKGFPTVPGRGGKERAMRLPDLTAYRKIKSRIVKAIEAGVSVTPDMTSHDLAEAAKKPAKAGTGTSDADVETPSNPNAAKPVAFDSWEGAISDVLKVMRAADKADVRARYASEIRELARMLANEEAAAKAAAEKKAEKKAA